MKQDTLLNFETYYFFKLLEKICEEGRQQYDEQDYLYLDKFVQFLQVEKDSQKSIEKLANFYSTSDLSIFFSDVIERLRKVSPEAAFDNISGQAKDFLEIFRVLLQDEEWRAYIDKESVVSEAAPHISTMAREVLNFQEFCDYVVRNKIEQRARELSPELREDFRNFLNTALTDRGISTSLQQRVPDTDVYEFLRIHSAIISQPQQIENLDAYIQTFEQQVEKWVDLFAGILKDHPRQIHEILVPEEAEATSISEEERPAEVSLESLFDSLDMEEVPRITLEEADERTGEIEELAARAEQLERKKDQRPEYTEEKRERRKFLRDYVISEAQAFHQEILTIFQNLWQDPQKTGVQEQFQDSLKALKDLGQIHGYPGIKLIAEKVLHTFGRVFRMRIKIPQGIGEELNALFKQLPDYIDANLAGNDASHLSRISRQLETLETLLLPEEETFGLQEAENLHGAFQEIVSRYCARIQETIGSRPVQEWREEELSALNPLYDNLIYWGKLLQLKEGVKSVEKLKEITTSSYYAQLSGEEVSTIAETLKFWKDRFTTASAQEWKSILTELDRVLNRYLAVPVEKALQAFQDVTLLQIDQIRERLHSGTISGSMVLKETLPTFFKQLGDNSGLMNLSGVAELCDHILGQLEGEEVRTVTPGEKEMQNLGDYLGQWRENISHLPEPVNAEFLQESFAELLRGILSEKETVQEEPVLPAAKPEEIVGVAPEKLGGEEEPLEQAQEVAAEAPEAKPTEAPGRITDKEIERVFNMEATKYIEQLKENLAKLQKEPQNRELWRKVGVIAHTLNGSAQMIGHQLVTELSNPLDDVVELIQEKSRSIESSLVEHLQELLDMIEKRLKGEAVDSTQLVNEIKEYMDSVVAQESVERTEESFPEKEEVSEAAPPPTQEEVEVPTSVEMADHIQLKEKDPELLSIFQQEVDANYDVIERNLTNLEKFTYDKTAWQEIERAVHELHSAAKMLGFSEIGVLAKQMEQLVERMALHEEIDSKQAIPLLRRAMSIVRELTTAHRVDRQTYEQVSRELEEWMLREPTAERVEKPEPAPPSVEPETMKEEPQPQFQDMFIQEARELLDDLNYLLLKLEKDPENTELKHHLMRSVHTLKGSAAMVRATHTETLAHLSEDILENFTRADLPLPPDLFDLLFRVVDELMFIVGAFQSDREERTKNYAELKEQLYAYMENMGIIPADRKVVPREEEAAAVSKEEFVRLTREPEKVPATSAETYIRLKLGQMNRLLNLAAELVIGHTQFKNQLDRLKNFLPMLDTELKSFRDAEALLEVVLKEERRIQEAIASRVELDPGVRESLKSQMENLERILKNAEKLQQEFASIAHTLKDNTKNYDENLQKLNKMSNELLDEIMQARLVPINLLFQRFHRPIRDLAHQFDKKIQLRILGENTELDRTLVEELYEPLMHIIRNAIDHGIESVKEREVAGKDPEGKLEIKASRDRNQVLIEIRDDGRGIDLEQVKKTALERGLLGEEDEEKFTDQMLLDFLFHPGFSTSQETTRVSGRGIGLDAVRAQIEKIKGDIRIYSEKGKGTTFLIRVPISLSVTQSMLVEVGGQVYSIPLFQVEETLNVSVRDLISDKGEYCLRYRGKSIPVVQMSHLLLVRGTRPMPISSAGNYSVIVVMDEGNRVALLVDKIVRREEILIKSLGASLRRLKYITGGSIMADGQVVLVLDIPQIIQHSLKITPRAGREDVVTRLYREATVAEKKRPRRRKKIIEGRKPIALVVDDSLSIRKYLSTLLTKKGFVTETARNGYEALDLLNRREFDIMITDLEMPKLSGYELIETVRLDERFTNFPIIVLTGRANINIRRLTENLGADAYIIKPFKDRELFEQIHRFIGYSP